MLRHTIVGIGSFLVLAGILSFLTPTIPPWGTLILLLAGAATTVFAVWILE